MFDFFGFFFVNFFRFSGNEFPAWGPEPLRGSGIISFLLIVFVGYFVKEFQKLLS